VNITINPLWSLETLTANGFEMPEGRGPSGPVNTAIGGKAGERRAERLVVVSKGMPL